MNVDAIDAVIAELRTIHPELQQPLTWNAMTRILGRERIVLFTTPLVHNAQVISCDGVSVIAINSNATVARHTYYAAHEWGHIKLHFRDPGEIVYHTTACWPDDPREDDAEHFATVLLMGPASASPPERRRRRAPYKEVPAPKPSVQVPLPLPPERPSPYDVHLGDRVTDPEDSIRHLLKASSPRLRARLDARDREDRVQRAVGLDLRPRVEHVREGRERKHYLIDRDGTPWRIYDLVPPGRKSVKLTASAVEPPHGWATERVFLRADGERRRYAFAFRESRDLDPAQLERQLSAASVQR